MGCSLGIGNAPGEIIKTEEGEKEEEKRKGRRREEEGGELHASERNE
jgi:hypothetical protein